MSEISINTVENIDEIYQIILLTTFTTKLHRYYRDTIHFLDFHQKKFWKLHHPTPSLLLPPSFYDLCESIQSPKNLLFLKVILSKAIHTSLINILKLHIQHRDKSVGCKSYSRMSRYIFLNVLKFEAMALQWHSIESFRFDLNQFIY